MAHEVDALLKRYESIASSRAVFEDGELSYYEDEIDNDLQECYLELLLLAALAIPSLRKGIYKYEDVHPALRVRSMYEFADYISSQRENYPMLDGYVETLQDWLWAPLHESLRKVFTLEVVEGILTKSEFDLAWRGYCEELELYSVDAYLIDEVSNAVNVITQLQALDMADALQMQKMIATLSMLQAITDNYVPIGKGGFTHSSAGLEDEISVWIKEITTNPQLLSIDDVLDINFVDVNPNIEPLKAGWLKLDAEITVVAENKFWELRDSHIESVFRTDRKIVGKKKNKICIHTLYQLQEIVIGESDESYNRPLDKWKICLLRTGLRHEYLPIEENGLLAAQLLTSAYVLETSLDNLSAEILWLRLGQRDSVLGGISRVEAEVLAKAYFKNS